MSRPPLSKLLPLSCLLLAGGSFYYYYGHLLTLHAVKEHRHTLLAWVDSHYHRTVAAYIAVMTLDIGLTIPGATTLSFTGGLLFGQPYAAAYAYVGYVLGACLSYVLVRTVLGDFARWLIPRESTMFKKLEANLHKNAFFYMIAARYTLVFPYWFVNGTAAIIEVPFRTFAAATAICVIPGAVIYTTAGRALGTVLDTLEDGEHVSALDVLRQTLGGEDVQVCAVCLAFCGGMTAFVHYLKTRDADTEKKAQ